MTLTWLFLLLKIQNGLDTNIVGTSRVNTRNIQCPEAYFIVSNGFENMAEALVGKWNFLSADNVDAYMDAIGVSEQLRELARNIKPTVEISKDGESWIIKTIAGDKTVETKFGENQEVVTNSLIGQEVKARLRIEGNKMIETQKVGDLEIVIERSVADGVYVSKMRANGVEAVLQFTKA